MQEMMLFGRFVHERILPICSESRDRSIFQRRVHLELMHDGAAFVVFAVASLYSSNSPSLFMAILQHRQDRVGFGRRDPPQ
jgi:hypothetical protein